MAGRNTSVSLDPHFTAFIENQVAQGRYSSASDVMRAGLRLLEAEEARLAAIRAALEEGERSGISDKTLMDIWAEVEREESQEQDG